MKKKTIKNLLLLMAGSLSILIAIAACSVFSVYQAVDPQNATLTALITPTSVEPTLDLKGNRVLEDQSCLITSQASISTFENAEDGGIFRWADDQNLFAFVAPENRYWGWFSGIAVVLDLRNDPKKPVELTTSGIHVFGDFAFNPDSSKLAFTAFRPSDNVYTVMVADLDSGLHSVVDLFPGLIADTDDFSSSKSVIEWINETELRLTTSCSVDCERILVANTKSGTLSQQEEVRKKGHSGRTFPQHVIEYDDRLYPAMSKANWSPADTYVFYTDTQDKTWIINDREHYQFALPISGDTVLQSLWSADERFLALRFSETISIYDVKCKQ